MTEAVRLVIWDLDETLWRGTITEGGIEHVPENYELICELARRGIMSSVCSKNDLGVVKAVLEEQGVWEYIIFPSVDWSPKGPRIAKIIEDVQLRPATVLFIDDNPGNRGEAAAIVPGLQVSDETVIPGLLANPLLRGKDDAGLSRLKQYKLLEKRKADEAASGPGGNADFLRSSNIRVFIDHDVVGNIDRAIELINRTNQLNFTKHRLPEDAEEARAMLKQLINRFDVQAGLVRVVDNYGDYGVVGLFVKTTLPTGSALHHFCFSCRTLGMGVEGFVYGLIGRPSLYINGDVLSNPIADPEVDWITVGDDGSVSHCGDAKKLPGIYLRGGCDMMAIGHYASMAAEEVIGEFNIERDGIPLRTDHSVIARYCIEGVPGGAKEAFRAIGYADEDLKSEIFTRRPGGTWLLSFSPDYWLPLFRHKATGALIPFVFFGGGTNNPLSIPESERTSVITSPQVLSAVEALERDFEFFGMTTDDDFRSNLRVAFGAVPKDAVAYVVQFRDFWGPNDTVNPNVARTNQIIAQIAEEFHNVQTINMMDFCKTREDVLPDGHLSRMVYYRIFEHIRDASSQVFA